MVDTPAKSWAGIALFSFLFVLIGMHLLVALWSVVGRSYAGDLSRYDEQLAANLAKLTELEWQVSGLRLEWHGANPLIAIDKLTVDFPAGKAIHPTAKLLRDHKVDNLLVVDEAHVYVDIVSSLLARELRLYGLRARQVSLTLEKNKHNEISLTGFTRNGGVQFGAIGFLNNLQYASLDTLDVRWVDKSLPEATLVQPPSLTLVLNHLKKKRQLHIEAANQKFHGLVRGKSVEHNAVDAEDHLAGEAEFAAAEIKAGDRFEYAVSSQGDLLKQGTNFESYFIAQGESAAAWLGLLSGAWQVQNVDIEAWGSKSRAGPVRAAININDADIVYVNDASLSNSVAVGHTNARNSIRLQNVRSLLSMRWHTSSEFELSWNDFRFRVSTPDQGRELALPNGALSAVPGWPRKDRFVLALPRWDVSPSMADVLALNVLPTRAQDILQTLDPSGGLKNIEFVWSGSSLADVRVQADVEGLSVQPWLGSPGIEGLSGRVIFQRDKGAFVLDSPSQLALFFPKIYTQKHVFHKASGELEWSVVRDRLLINGVNLSLQSLDGKVDYGAGFNLDAKIKKDAAPSNLRLEAGFTHAKLQELTDFVPLTLPSSLLTWIEQSGAAGTVNEGAFIYNGSLAKGDSENRNVQIYLDLEDASALYAPDWPPVERLTGLLTINPSQSALTLSSAAVQGVDLFDAQIDIHTSEQKSFIDIESKLVSSFSDALSFLQQTPAGVAVTGILGEWTGSGLLQEAALSLRVPLGTNERALDDLKFTAVLDNVALQMNNLELELEQVRGPIAYSLANGLESKGLQATLWQQPWLIKLGDRGTSGLLQAADNVFIDAQGAAEMGSIGQWLQQPVFGFASGVANVDVRLEHTSINSALMIRSDLKNVVIDAPSPFYKPAAQALPTTIKWNLSQKNQPLSLQLLDALQGRFEFDNFALDGGVITLTDPDEFFNDEFNFSPDSGASAAVQSSVDENSYELGALVINGRLKEFNLTAWQRALDRYQGYEELLQSASSSMQSAATDGAPLSLKGKNLRIDHALAFDQDFNDAVVSFAETEDESAWQFDLESDVVKGLITLPSFYSNAESPLSAVVANATVDAPGLSAVAVTNKTLMDLDHLPNLPELSEVGRRIVLDLDYLRFSRRPPAIKSEASSSEPAALLEPAQLQPLDVSIDNLYVGEQSYGAWNFLLTSSSNAVLAHDIRAQFSTLTFRSDEDDGLLWAYDEQGAMVSALNLRASSEDFSQFLDRMVKNEGQLPMHAKRLEADLSLSWSGAPEQISLQGLNGDLTFSFKEGRFFQASESTTGFLKLLGLFNFDSLVRRIQLDFTDVYKQGLSFDEMKGELLFSNNLLSFADVPIQVTSPSSKFSMAGAIDMRQSTIDAELIATMPVANNLPWIAALAGGPAAAAGAFIVTRVLGDQFDQLSSAAYSVQGRLDDPKVKFERLFDNEKTKSQATTALP